MSDESITLMGGEGSAFTRTNSLGVLLGVMPWNFPYYQIARFAGLNLMIGNRIILKHASQCSESAASGFPTGAYTNFYAESEQVAKVIADPRVQGASLTGSERAGVAVAEVAGRHLKKVVLELGGSGPVHPAQHGRHGCDGGGRRRWPPGQQWPVLQRGEALHRDRRAVRRVPRQVHRRPARAERERPDRGRR